MKLAKKKRIVSMHESVAGIWRWLNPHLIGFVLIIAALTFPRAVFAEACQAGVCASSRTDGYYVNVRYRTTSYPVTHVNIRGQFQKPEPILGGPSQLDQAPKGSFRVWVGKGYSASYQIQACNRSGLLGRSACGRWARFTHRVTPGI